MKVYWGKWKAVLLFLGLIAKGVALGDPLPFYWGKAAKAVSAVIWGAFDGAFLWLLTPPKPRQEQEREESEQGYRDDFSA